MKQKPILLSGIQPSGQLGIGHYAGAIQNWINMQQDFDCLFMLADLHTLTVRQDPKVFKQRCLEVLALYIACGIDPNKNILFAQSQVPQHSQLMWILNCYTQMGELNRMTQFKDKSKRHAENINAGLWDYPVLMAADILLYQSNLVPVGEDQKQHLELTRDIAMRFNHLYGEIFTIPEAYIPQQGARVMSLQEPTQKMSKSDPNESSYVAFLDSPEIILNKFKRAVTDSGNEIYFDREQKPGISNLLTIFSIFSEQSLESIAQEFNGQGYGKFKIAVADAVIEKIRPIQQRYNELISDPTLLNQILKKGAEAAQQRGENTFNKVREAVGLL